MKNRKRFIFESAILVLLFIALFVCVNKIETSYTRKAKVTYVENNTVLFEDENGNIWEWEKERGEREYREGENVILKMDTNNTDTNVFDDIIKRVKREV